MGFWDYLEIVVFAGMICYFLWSGMQLMRGGEAHITGYTYLTEKDKACYDEKKLKSCHGLGYFAAAFGSALFILGQFSGRSQVIALGFLVFILGFAVPSHLLKRTQYFIKK